MHLQIRKLLKKMMVPFVIGLISSCSCSVINKVQPKVDDYKIVINRNTKINITSGLYVHQVNKVGYLFYLNGLTRENKNFVFDNTGVFETVSGIKGLKQIDLKISSGAYTVKYGYESENYEFTSKEINTTKAYTFNDDHPTFFKISFKERTVVNSMTISFDLKDYESPFKKIPLSPTIELDEHTYNVKQTVEFPSFEETEGLSYHLSDDGTYYVVDNIDNTMEIGEENRIVFPSYHEGLPVKVIGHLGFTERWWIFEIYIPETIVSIDIEAFSMCGLTKIYWDAENCNDFPARNAIFAPGDDHNHQNIDLVFGPHVKRIPARMMLPSMMTPNVHPIVNSVSFSEDCQIESIGEYAFYGLNNIERIDIPDSVKVIEQYAFYGCGLKELDFR